jgi:serine/threonine-protein kinase
MDPAPTSDQTGQPAACLPRQRTDVVTLVFTDIVGSTALKQRLGDRAGTELLHRHHQLLRETLARFPEASEIGVAGDSFFIVLAKPSESVRFALELQARLRQFNQGAPPEMVVEDRIGLHLGEVLIEPGERQHGADGFQGIHVDLCSRVMSLASAGQILLTRPVFDNARQVLKGEALEGVGPLSWLSHGLYELKGVDEPVEICEVADVGWRQPVPPPSTEKARRVTDAQGAPVLGWRPAIGQVVPNTHWQLERQSASAASAKCGSSPPDAQGTRVFKFCFQADRARGLKREMTLFRLLRERIGEHPHIVSLREVFFDEPPYYLKWSMSRAATTGPGANRRGRPTSASDRDSLSRRLRRRCRPPTTPA